MGSLSRGPTFFNMKKLLMPLLFLCTLVYLEGKVRDAKAAETKATAKIERKQRRHERRKLRALYYGQNYGGGYYPNYYWNGPPYAWRMSYGYYYPYYYYQRPSFGFYVGL